MDSNFTHKVRLVTRGHNTEPFLAIMYSIIATRESVRIVFLISVLNNLAISTDDIGNAYLNAPC